MRSPPPPPPATQQYTKHNKILIQSQPSSGLFSKREEYDLWAMKMDTYLAQTDYPIGSQKNSGLEKEEEKLGPPWLLAIPVRVEVHLESNLFEGFTVSNSVGFTKAMERFQSLLSQLEIHGAVVTMKMQSDISKDLYITAWLQLVTYYVELYQDMDHLPTCKNVALFLEISPTVLRNCCSLLAMALWCPKLVLERTGVVQLELKEDNSWKGRVWVGDHNGWNAWIVKMGGNRRRRGKKERKERNRTERKRQETEKRKAKRKK
ncbi:hypothetical protein Tco_0065660 [Tanacetum coccineum]